MDSTYEVSLSTNTSYVILLHTGWGRQNTDGEISFHIAKILCLSWMEMDSAYEVSLSTNTSYVILLHSGWGKQNTDGEISFHIEKILWNLKKIIMQGPQYLLSYDFSKFVEFFLCVNLLLRLYRNFIILPFYILDRIPHAQ